MAIKRFTRPKAKNQTKKDNSNRDPPIHIEKYLIIILICVLIYAGVVYWIFSSI